jgi:hypothetical protein
MAAGNLDILAPHPEKMSSQLAVNEKVEENLQETDKSPVG